MLVVWVVAFDSVVVAFSGGVDFLVVAVFVHVAFVDRVLVVIVVLLFVV